METTRPAGPDIHRRWLLGAAGISGATVLAGCGKEAPTAGGSTTSSTISATTTTPVPEPVTAALVQRFIDEAWNQGDLGVIDEIFTFPYTIKSLNVGTPTLPPIDAAGLKDHVMTYRNGFPDLKLTTEQVVEQGDSAFLQTRLTGTHTGEYMGIPPSGGSADFILSAVYHSANAKLTGHEVVVDLMGLFHQIGLLPDLFTIVTTGLGKAK